MTHPSVLPSEATARCRVCGRPYAPGRFDADLRCLKCLVAGRWWTAEQLGTRAVVCVRAPYSVLDGQAGEGVRVSQPGDGWLVKLFREPERRQYFGAGAVIVDWELAAVPEAERSVFALVASRERASTSRQTAQDEAQAHE